VVWGVHQACRQAHGSEVPQVLMEIAGIVGNHWPGTGTTQR
jgi:hypothetical protein